MQRFADPGVFRVVEGNESERGSEDSRFRARERRKEPRLGVQPARSLPARRLAEHAGRRTHAAGCRDEADDLENLACEWRGDARTMRGISVLNFARRSWQRVTRPEAVAGCSAAGCNDVWLWLWVVVRVVGISITYLHLSTRDWDLIYVAPSDTAKILRRPVTAECRPGFVAEGEYPVMSTTTSFRTRAPCARVCAWILIRRVDYEREDRKDFERITWEECNVW